MPNLVEDIPIAVSEAQKLEASPIRSRKDIYKLILVLLALPLLLYVVYQSPLRTCLEPSYIAQIQKNIPMGYLVAPCFFCLLGGLFIGLGLPRTMISLAAGGIFGLWLGLWLAQISSLLGIALIFFSARWTKNTFFREQMTQVQKFDEIIKKHALLVVILARQMPLPAFVTNIVLGFSGIPKTIFFGGSFLGMLPQTLIFTLYGCGMKGDFVINITIASCLLMAFFFGCFYLFHRVEMAKTLWLQLQSFRKKSL